MKILFLLDEVYGINSATALHGRLLAEELAGLGHQVAVLENTPGPAAPDVDAAGVRHLPFYCEKEQILYRLVARCRRHGMGALRIALHALASPRAIWVAIQLLVCKRSPVERVFRKKIEQQTSAGAYDVVLAVAAPHYTALALARAKMPAGQKAVYLLDPYAYAHSQRFVSSRRRERQMYRGLDAVFVTDRMAEQQLYPAQWESKVQPLHLCSLRPLVLQNPPGYNNAYINCVFVGNLYLDIRRPDYLLELFARLPERYRLVLIGHGYELFPPAYRAHYQRRLGPRLLVLPPVTRPAAADAMCDADFLVNLGNRDPGQMPSKVLEYFATGRPVLNICKLPDCPTRPLMEQYPLAMTIEETPNVETATVERVEAFLGREMGKQIPYAQVQALFEQYTPAAVARKMLQELQKLQHTAGLPWAVPPKEVQV